MLRFYFCIRRKFIYLFWPHLVIVSMRFSLMIIFDLMHTYSKSPHNTDSYYMLRQLYFYLWTKSKYIHFLTALLTRPLFFVFSLFLVYHKPKLCNSIQSSHDNISFKQISQSFSRLFAPLSLDKMLFKTLFKRPAFDAFQFLRICTNARFRLYT